MNRLSFLFLVLLLAAASGQIKGRSSLGSQNFTKIIHVAGNACRTVEAAIAACSGKCLVDASNTALGNQTFTVNPFAGIAVPLTRHLRTLYGPVGSRERRGGLTAQGAAAYWQAILNGVTWIDSSNAVFASCRGLCSP